MNETTRTAQVEPPATSHVGGFDLDRLPRTPLAELRRLWIVHVGPRTPPPRQKGVLVRELAWRVQARLYGDLDAATRALLHAAMRRAAKVLRARMNSRAAPGTDCGSAFRPDAHPRPHARPRRAAAALRAPDGSRLLRTWKGRAHEVQVLDGGRRFRYQGEEYRSLSEIARLITGARWSGPRFFGLVHRRRDSLEPKA